MTEPLILYATMTGNARDAAEMLKERLRAQGAEPRVEQMKFYDPARLGEEKTVFFLTSTFGNGEPPDSAFAFWDILRKADDLNLAGLSYAVAAFGDSTYPRFCQYGQDLDARLETLGARRLRELQKHDVDWENDYQKWLDDVLNGVTR